MTTPTITQAQAERMADRRVQAWLAVDSAYRNAVDAETQAAREQEISEMVWTEIQTVYEVVS